MKKREREVGLSLEHVAHDGDGRKRTHERAQRKRDDPRDKSWTFNTPYHYPQEN